MKLFKCSHCGQLVYFENTYCERCAYPLGFDCDSLDMITVVETSLNSYTVIGSETQTSFRYCDNYQYGVCNWLVPSDSSRKFCKACELNRTIPNLSKQTYAHRWKIIEQAKHRLIYALLCMQLPPKSKFEDPEKGLWFDFLADEEKPQNEKIFTGHNRGLITINIAEADDIEREMAKRALDEPYRTVLGHLRHEIGHYYWDRLILEKSKLEEFRKLFGDERLNYQQALQDYYGRLHFHRESNSFISNYATAHPWEDWAETWAHYMHILDTEETAFAFGLILHPSLATDSSTLDVEIKRNPYSVQHFEHIIDAWLPLTFAMNSLNRSMGLQDPYPFIISVNVISKLKFIHEVRMQAMQAN